MAADSFSAAGDTSGTGEPLVATTVHWGTAQLGAPPSHQPAAWPQALEQDPEDVPQEQAAYADDDGPPRVAPDTDDAPSEQVEPSLHDDTVDELIRVAVVSRPLDDVVDLVTLLEQSPAGVTTAASVLRLAAVARSVDDVTRLVELLGPPEHPADHMDEAIRHAAEERPVPEVSRLVHLLSRPPHDAHSSAEAVHAAGTTRSVEDLMQLIGSLKEHKAADYPEVKAPDAPLAPPAGAEAGYPAAPADQAAQDAEAAAAQATTPLLWLRRVAGVLLLLCAAAHFPLNWSDAPTVGLFAALGVSVVCALSGAALCLSGSPIVAVASTLVAGAVTIGHLLDDRVNSTTLAYVLRPDGVTAPIPTLTAVAATLAALLVVALTVTRLRSATNRNATPRL